MPEQDVFAVVPAGRRTWAVASVHGESDRLGGLHAALHERVRPGDSLIYLGNLMGYGPQVFQTIQQVLLFRRALLARPHADCADIVFLRGHQEEMWHRLLQIQFAVNPSQVLKWMLDHGIESTITAYGSTAAEGIHAASKGAVALTEWTSRLRVAMRAADGHNALMSALRRAAYTENQTLLFVNTGIDVARPLPQQFDSFWWGATPFDSIAAPFANFRRVVRGFDPRRRGVVIGEVTASLDGGCGRGGPLHAVCFDPAGDAIETLEA
jgi:serine/threonine protein phosphatase 1